LRGRDFGTPIFRERSLKEGSRRDDVKPELSFAYGLQIRDKERVVIREAMYR
jgi:hypothetical protein